MRGSQASLQARYAQSKRLVYSVGLSMSAVAGDNVELGELTLTDPQRIRLPQGKAKNAMIGLQFGAHYRLSRPGARFEWQVGGLLEFQAYNHQYSDLIVYEATGSNLARVATGESDNRGTVIGLAPTTRLAYRPLRSLGVAVDATAGFMGHRKPRNSNGPFFGYYAIQAGIFYEFGR